MANRFGSFLQHLGRGFKTGLSAALPAAEVAGRVGVIFAPALGPLFNQTLQAIATAEQNAAAIGKQSGSGADKLTAVTGIMGGLIKQGLTDAGRPSDGAAVDKYVSAIVTVLNAIPAPVAGLPVSMLPLVAPSALDNSPPVSRSPHAPGPAVTVAPLPGPSELL